MARLAYLGPPGTFTEEAALRYRPDADLIACPTEGSVVGRPLRDVLLPHQSLIWGIVDTEGNPKAPTVETAIHAGDEVVAVTLKESEEALRAALTQPPPERSF